MRPAYRDLLANGRAGFPLTRVASQRLGALVGRSVYPALKSPSQVTIAALALAAVALFTCAALVRAGAPAPGGIVLLVGLHLSYGLDCADGQIARLNGQATPAGARLDVLCDTAVHTLVFAWFAGQSELHPVPAAVAVSILSMQAVYAAVLRPHLPEAADRPLRRLAYVVNLARDYALQITTLALSLLFDTSGHQKALLLLVMAGAQASAMIWQILSDAKDSWAPRES